MTYISGNPVRMTPEAKLADKNWRRTNSWWILPPLLSCGFLCWLGFLVAAARTGKRTYWIFTAIYATVFGIFATLAVIADGDNESLASDLAVIPFLVAWIAPTVHAAILNRDYLRTLAAKGVWYQSPVTPTAHGVTPSPQGGPSFLGVSQHDYYVPTPQQTPPPAQASAPSPPPQHRYPAAVREPQPRSTAPAARVEPQAQPVPSVVPANTVTSETLAQLPGVSPALAQRVVAVRDARGGYRDIDDLAAAANLQPHELVRLRNHLTFDQETPNPSRHEDPPQHGATGRILDI